MEDANDQVTEVPKAKKMKKSAPAKPEEPADSSIMRMVSSLEGAVLRLVNKCSDRGELAEILIDTSDSSTVVSAVLLKLSVCAPSERSDSEAMVFKALVRVLGSDKTTREMATLAVASVPTCQYGSDANELATALLATALRFPDLAKSCAITINSVRGAFTDVSWPNDPVAA